ncbi:MAG: hypothetical protein LH478_14415 [Chitinophagaceae bacterium]|nr:hypothetical protein [Chitinophagaceae bacterium]
MRATTLRPNDSKNVNFGKTLVITEIYDFKSEINFKNFTVPVPMTEQEVAPPLHVWDKIARILDEQDSKKQFHQQSPLHSFQPQIIFQTKNNNYNKYILAFTGAAVVVVLVWFLA